MDDIADLQTQAASVSVHAAEAAAYHAPNSDPPPWMTALAEDPCYDWLRVQWARCQRTKGCYYDPAAAEAIVAKWPIYFRMTVDRFATQPFHLATYQAAVVRMIFGWRRVIDVMDIAGGKSRRVAVRHFRRLLLWLPRKGAKTEFMASLALAVWALTPVYAGEGYCFARNEEQGRIAFERMKRMSTMSNEFQAFDIQPSARNLFLPGSHSNFSLVSGAEKGKHGKIPSVILGDEMHEWTDRTVMEVLSQGCGPRLEPMELYASTCGRGSDGPGLELYEETQQIIDGRIDDPTTLGVIFAADPKDDIYDERTWAKANPLLGVTPTLDFLRGKAAAAKLSRDHEENFKAYHLNIWAEAVDRWINLNLWDASGGDDADAWKSMWTRNKGRKCILGYDLAATKDFTALVALFEPDENGRRDLAVKLWLPSGALAEMPNRERSQRERWAAAGAFNLIDTQVMDQDLIGDAIEQAMVDYKVQRIAFDGYFSTKLYTDLIKADVPQGLFLEVRQGHTTLGDAIVFFEQDYANRKALNHGHHPVLRWMAGNVVMRTDANNNKLPGKKVSRANIDGIAATLNAYRAMLIAPQKSIYATRGLIAV